MVGFLTFVVLLGLGFFFGRMNEARHFSRLDRREAELAHITVSNIKQIPDGMTGSIFVDGNVVVSIDYFKRIGAALRGLVGGRVNTYTTLLERARREAIVRMKTQADETGAVHIANLRLESASVFNNAQAQIGSIEVYAYGTALR